MDSRRVFLGVTAIVIAASAAMTIATCVSMSAMGEMAMPGGWTMSHMWMRIPGQSWLGATASFVAMWLVMMVAMMLPSLVPTLLCYRDTAGATGAARPGSLSALVAVGYFAVWAAVGAMVFPLGTVFANVMMRESEASRVVPVVVGVTVVVAGVVQHSRWKARHLAVCRGTPGAHLTKPVGMAAAWRHGVHIGFACTRSCAGLTAVALAFGMMDLRVMAIVGAAITFERRARNGERVGRVIGVIVTTVGFALLASAADLARG